MNITETISAKDFQSGKLRKSGNSDKQKGSAAKDTIEFTLIGLKLVYVKELQFAPPRKFRFDFAIPELKIAIEYEGLMSEKSVHTTIDGFTSNCEKYNLAQIMGWKVLRYTALNFGDVLKDLEKIIKC